MTGLPMPKLGSPKDIVLRQYLSNESEKAETQAKLLALLVANSVPYSSQEASSAWEKKVKKVYSRYLELEYGVKLPAQSEKEVEMLEYYNTKIKNMKLKLSKNKDKGLVVTGFYD